MLQDTARNYEARQSFDDSGVAVTIIKFRCDGFTEEHFARWKADPIAVQLAMNEKMEAERLDDDEGCKVYHMKMKMPMMISNRSIVTTFYEHTDPATNT